MSSRREKSASSESFGVLSERYREIRQEIVTVCNITVPDFDSTDDAVTLTGGPVDGPGGAKQGREAAGIHGLFTRRQIPGITRLCGWNTLHGLFVRGTETMKARAVNADSHCMVMYNVVVLLAGSILLTCSRQS